jgi:DNA-directed RNA polymerase III subunit RPC6
VQSLQLIIFCSLQIDETQGEQEPIFANIAMTMPESSPLNEVPCGQCPVIGECADGNDISPATCQYMQAWLDF